MIEMVGEFSEIAEAESPLAKLAEDTDVPSSEELDELIEKAFLFHCFCSWNHSQPFCIFL